MPSRRSAWLHVFIALPYVVYYFTPLYLIPRPAPTGRSCGAAGMLFMVGGFFELVALGASSLAIAATVRHLRRRDPDSRALALWSLIGPLFVWTVPLSFHSWLNPLGTFSLGVAVVLLAVVLRTRLPREDRWSQPSEV
jgi:hypothetical protein